MFRFYFVRTGLDRCMNIVEQGDLVREDIEDMLMSTGDPENRNSEPPAMRARRAAMEQPEGIALSDELKDELEIEKKKQQPKQEL